MISLTRIAMVAALAALPMAATSALATPKHCPPGHAKKGWCKPGTYSSLPPGLRYKHFDRWEEAGLRRPRRGEIYVEVDREIYLILEATREVIEAAGAVSRVLN